MLDKNKTEVNEITIGFYPCTQVEYDNMKNINPKVMYVVGHSEDWLRSYLEEHGHKSDCLR